MFQICILFCFGARAGPGINKLPSGQSSCTDQKVDRLWTFCLLLARVFRRLHLDSSVFSCSLIKANVHSKTRSHSCMGFGRSLFWFHVLSRSRSDIMEAKFQSVLFNVVEVITMSGYFVRKAFIFIDLVCTKKDKNHFGGLNNRRSRRIDP